MKVINRLRIFMFYIFMNTIIEMESKQRFVSLEYFTLDILYIFACYTQICTFLHFQNFHKYIKIRSLVISDVQNLFIYALCEK